MSTPYEQKKAKLRFAALYAFSLILMFVVISAFWQKEEAMGNEPSPFEQQLQQANAEIGKLRNDLQEKEKQLVTVQAKAQADLLEKNNLITSLQAQSNGKGGALPPSPTSKDGSGEWQQKYALLKVAYDKAIANEVALKTACQQEKNKAVAAVEAQKQKDLVAKETFIASLQAQLKQKTAGGQKPVNMQPTTDVVSTEWKQKYTSLKSLYDKAVGREKSLQAAYKTVADDNRRLLNQLQTMKKS